MALRMIAKDGDAVLAVDGEVGVILDADGTFSVGLKATIIAMGNGSWEAHEGPMPVIPRVVLDRVAALKREHLS